MPAVIPLIVAGVSAGTSIYAANKQAGTQQNAANTQANAANQSTQAQLQAAQDALKFQEQVYNAKQQAVNPYQNMGSGALAALGNGLGVTPGTMKPTTIPLGPNPAGSVQPITSPATGANNGQTISGTVPASSGIGQNAATLSQSSLPPTTFNSVMDQVKLSSPDGSETQMVPRSQMQYYLARGAKVVQ